MMTIWVELGDDADKENFPDGAGYEVLMNGVLRITSGTDIHLYCPGFWRKVTVDTHGHPSPKIPFDDDVDWQ